MAGMTWAQLLYPEHLKPVQVIASIRSVLAASDEKFLLDPRLDLENYIHRICWLAGVHPAVPLVALQREQSLLSNDGKEASERAFSRATGWVGQHLPGTASLTWDGLPVQLLLCVRSAAWHGGIGDELAFGYRSGLRPTTPRWKGDPLPVQLLNLDATPARVVMCQSAMEFVDWIYTPNAQKDIPALNLAIYERFVKPHFCEG